MKLVFILFIAISPALAFSSSFTYHCYPGNERSEALFDAVFELQLQSSNSSEKIVLVNGEAYAAEESSPFLSAEGSLNEYSYFPGEYSFLNLKNSSAREASFLIPQTLMTGSVYGFLFLSLSHKSGLSDLYRFKCNKVDLNAN